MPARGADLNCSVSMTVYLFFLQWRGEGRLTWGSSLSFCRGWAGDCPNLKCEAGMHGGLQLSLWSSPHFGRGFLDNGGAKNGGGIL
jgi:hypothetical protein